MILLAPVQSADLSPGEVAAIEAMFRSHARADFGEVAAECWSCPVVSLSVRRLGEVLALSASISNGRAVTTLHRTVMTFNELRPALGEVSRELALAGVAPEVRTRFALSGVVDFDGDSFALGLGPGWLVDIGTIRGSIDGFLLVTDLHGRLLPGLGATAGLSWLAEDAWIGGALGLSLRPDLGLTLGPELGAFLGAEADARPFLRGRAGVHVAEGGLSPAARVDAGLAF